MLRCDGSEEVEISSDDGTSEMADGCDVELKGGSGFWETRLWGVVGAGTARGAAVLPTAWAAATSEGHG